jgi:hypothetical protein
MNIVRANKVCEAVKWLREHSQLYKEEGIIVEDQWELSAQDDIDSNNDSDMENKICMNGVLAATSLSSSCVRSNSGGCVGNFTPLALDKGGTLFYDK